VDDEQFGTTNDYLRAFDVVRAEGIPDYQMALLKAHLTAPGYTTTWARIAEAVGYPNGSTVNLLYGKFAQRIARELGFTKKPLDPEGNASWVVSACCTRDVRRSRIDHSQRSHAAAHCQMPVRVSILVGK
jgi:hypothetical protein